MNYLTQSVGHRAKPLTYGGIALWIAAGFLIGFQIVIVIVASGIVALVLQTLRKDLLSAPLVAVGVFGGQILVAIPSSIITPATGLATIIELAIGAGLVVWFALRPSTALLKLVVIYAIAEIGSLIFLIAKDGRFDGFDYQVLGVILLRLGTIGAAILAIRTGVTTADLPDNTAETFT